MTQPDWRPQHHEVVMIRPDANTDPQADRHGVAVTPAALGCRAVIEHNWRDEYFAVVVVDGPMQGKWQTVAHTDLAPVRVVIVEDNDIDL